MLFNLMVFEGFEKDRFKGFIVTNSNKNKNLPLNFFNQENLKLEESIIISEFSDLKKLNVFSSIGYSSMNRDRQNAFKDIENFSTKLELKSFISKDAYVSKNVNIEKGSLILPRSIIEPNVVIKKGSVIWYGSQVCHDSTINEFCWIAASAVVGANCIIGKRSFLGIGAKVPTGSRIAKGNIISAGSIAPKFTSENKVIISNKGDMKINKNEFNSDEFIRFL